MSTIEWTDETINHIIGCNPLSDGCKHCYAKSMFFRQRGMKKSPQIYKDMKDFTDVKWDMNILINKLKTYKKPRRIFLCSMSDLLHDKVPNEIIKETLEIISKYPQHTFYILTKRYERLRDVMYSRYCPENIKFGVSICNNKDLKTASDINYRNKIFVSFEPLLENLYFDNWVKRDFINNDVNWVIVGAESGPGRREFKEEWGLNILVKARHNNIPFFFKRQFINKESTNLLAGKEYTEYE